MNIVWGLLLSLLPPFYPTEAEKKGKTNAVRTNVTRTNVARTNVARTNVARTNDSQAIVAGANGARAMRLCHPLDGSTSPKYKLLCFKPP